MATNDFDRKHLTFSQAEGLEELPTSLALREVSKELRALLWSVVHRAIRRNMEHQGLRHTLGDRWKLILEEKHVFFDHEMVDDFSANSDWNLARLRLVFSAGDYAKIFDTIQFFLRHPSISNDFADQIEGALRHSRAAYTVVDKDTIVPLASPEEGRALTVALADLSDGPFRGARTHLKTAAERLNSGAWAASVRESISAVEAVARVWEPHATSLDPALKSLGKTHRLHPALLAGFGKLYGFTNDEKGIRHALLDKAAPAVDEADAVYMLGACAAFTSYLVRRHREAQTASTHEQG